MYFRASDDAIFSSFSLSKNNGGFSAPLWPLLSFGFFFLFGGFAASDFSAGMSRSCFCPNWQSSSFFYLSFSMNFLALALSP